MGMDLSDLQALMGGAFDEPAGETGGVWVVSPDGTVNDGMLRLIGKARVVADALGGYVYVLAGCNASGADTNAAIHAGGDKVLTAGGVPSVDDLVEFFRERQPQAVLLPRTQLGRSLAPGLSQLLGGSLCRFAADLAVDAIYQRIVAHQPILDDAARMQVSLLGSPAVVLLDTELLPAAFKETWRQGDVSDTGLNWAEPPAYEMVELPAQPVTLQTASTVIVAGQGLGDEAGFAAAKDLADALGGVVAGDVTAFDAGWITKEELVGLVGATIAPKLCIALGVDGDTNFMMGVAEAGCMVAVQGDAAAPIMPFADYNVVGDPAEFARALAEGVRR
ncbi:MAG: electron transfer flavoprotein subunit alpha/FixB family protein [Nitrososphaerales archaeon]